MPEPRARPASLWDSRPKNAIIFAPMSIAALVLIGLLSPAFNPGWPPADPETTPETLARPESMPDDPDYPPRMTEDGGCAGQLGLYSFIPECASAIDPRERELELGTGVHADRSWLWTTGRPEVLIGFLD